MRKIQFSMKTLAAAAIALFMAGCANDETAQDSTAKHPGIKGMTEFAVVDNGANAKALPAMRTMGIYTGSSIKFYWTSNDRLWINNTAATPPLKASSRSDIPDTGGKELTAKFYFDGIYSAPSYPVRYTGNGNPVGDKVTIKSVQAQQTPNDGSHIGTDGDCGTAVANRQSDGSYQFTLAHKASYLTFMPYYSKVFDPSVKVTQIKVTADQAVAGTYDFNDSGIQVATGTSTSTSITLTLNGGGDNGFAIPNIADYSQNAAIMVLAPGTYDNFTVEYTLYDQVTNVTGTICKNYGTVTCNEGKNKKIEYDLAITNYESNLYYMWDAKYHYWHGYENEQPALNGTSNPNFPHDSSDQRWHKEGGGTGRFDATTALFQPLPNVNEMLWYLEKGNPCWDSKRIWATMKHLYKGGAWFKKKSKIVAEQGINIAYMKEKAPNGNDYRAIETPQVKRTPSTTIPNASELSDYFYLPALGNYLKQPVSGSLYGGLLTARGSGGYYWSSSAHQSTGNAYGLFFNEPDFIVGYFYRSYGFRVGAFE